MRDDAIPVRFDGEPLTARRGETLLAALTAAGVVALRRTAGGEPRGAWCGMGACQECVVRLGDGRVERACMVKVDRPVDAFTITDPLPLGEGAAAHPPRRGADLPLVAPDLLVIGAGPAGLAAAVEARAAGLDVLLVDERAAPGGQYFKPLTVTARPGPDAQHRAGTALVAEARARGVVFAPETLVWGAFPGPVFAATGPAGAMRIAPRAAILGTGAVERAWHVPGWTLPGVMTTGAAQTLWRSARRVPRGRILIAGNGPLNLQLAAELLGAGAEVVGLAEAAAAPRLRDWLAVMAMAAAAPALVVQGARYRQRLVGAGVPMRHATVVSRVEAGPDGLVVSLAGGEPGDVTVDTLCLGYGLDPANELARALGCTFVADAESGRLVPERDADGGASVAGIYLVGDGVRLGGAHVAMAEGRLAGTAAAAWLGRPVDPLVRQHARETLRRHRRFQRALWQLYAPAMPLVPATTPETLLCRCERVTAAAVDAAIAAGHGSAGSVKQATRLGMGRCQGRYCTAALTERLGRSGDPMGGFAPRAPVRPIAIGDLAR